MPCYLPLMTTPAEYETFIMDASWRNKTKKQKQQKKVQLTPSQKLPLLDHSHDHHLDHGLANINQSHTQTLPSPPLSVIATEFTDSENDCYDLNKNNIDCHDPTSISRILSSATSTSAISFSRTCSTCTVHKPRLAGSFLHPVYPMFPSWNRSKARRQRQRGGGSPYIHHYDDKHEDNDLSQLGLAPLTRVWEHCQHYEEEVGHKHDRLRARGKFSRVSHGLKERLVTYKHHREEERVQKREEKAEREREGLERLRMGARPVSKGERLGKRSQGDNYTVVIVLGAV